MKKKLIPALPVFLCLVLAGPAASQATREQTAAVRTAAQYRVVPNVVYSVADNYESKLDLYLPRG